MCALDCMLVCLVRSTKRKVIAIRDHNGHKYVFIIAVVKLIDSNVMWEKPSICNGLNHEHLFLFSQYCML